MAKLDMTRKNPLAEAIRDGQSIYHLITFQPNGNINDWYCADQLRYVLAYASDLRPVPLHTLYFEQLPHVLCAPADSLNVAN